MVTPNEVFRAKKLQSNKGKVNLTQGELETLLNYYDLRLEGGNCPLCDEGIDLGYDSGNHQEVTCDCGFHYCITCRYIFD